MFRASSRSVRAARPRGGAKPFCPRLRPNSRWPRVGAIVLAAVLAVDLVLDHGVAVAGRSESAPASRLGPALAWQRLDDVAVRDEPLRIAVEHKRSPHGSEAAAVDGAPSDSGVTGLAVADASGVSWWRGGRSLRSAVEGVRDLAFDAGGELWIATGEGLWRWRADERPRRHTLPGGPLANRVARLASSGAGVLAATEAGGFLSIGGGPWRSLTGGGVARPVSLVAISSLPLDPNGARGRAGAAPTQVAWIEDTRLRIARLQIRAGATALGTVASYRLPRTSDERAPVELLPDPSGRAFHVIHPDAVATLHFGLGGPRPEWLVERPVLSPGAELRAAVWTETGLWWATEHGVFHGPGLAGPFRRVEPPLGTARCHDLASDARDRLLVLCRRALYVRSDRPTAFRTAAATTNVPTEAEAPLAAIPADPPLALLRARALERSGLDPERARGWLRGVGRRGFWPSLSLRLGADFDREREWKSDQSFVSGDTRSLFDRGRDRGESFFASLELEWELSELAYPLETTDLSRELRQVVSLRDDVSDEIHQLYFERRALLERLASAPPLERDERRALLRRAEEIAAGLDAWTDGFLSRWRREHRARETP